MYFFYTVTIIYIYTYGPGIYLYTHTILPQWGHLCILPSKTSFSPTFQDSVAVSSNPTLGGAMVPGIGWWDPGWTKKGVRVDGGANDTMTRWWFQIFVYVHPQLGKIPIFTNIFQMCWNHQPDEHLLRCSFIWLIWCFFLGFRNEIFQKSLKILEQLRNLFDANWQLGRIWWWFVSCFFFGKIFDLPKDGSRGAMTWKCVDYVYWCLFDLLGHSI